MGGVAILAGIWAGYLGTHLAGLAFNGEGPSASGLLVLFLATTLGAVGFVDDLIKIRRSRNLGLNKTAKTVGQITAAVLVGVLVLQFRNDAGLTPGTSDLSYVREIATVTLAPALFVLFCVVVVSAWSNAVNFTDGLDGLAAGSMGMVSAASAVLALIPWLVTVRERSTVLTRLRVVAVGAVTAAVVASPQLVAMVQQAHAGGTTAPAASAYSPIAPSSAICSGATMVRPPARNSQALM